MLDTLRVWPNLVTDKHMWSVGSGYQVSIVILVNILESPGSDRHLLGGRHEYIYSSNMAVRVKAEIKIKHFLETRTRD